MVDSSDLYLTESEFRDYLQDDSTLNAGPVRRAISSASRSVDKHCGRWFNHRDLTLYTSPNVADADYMWVLPLPFDIATTDDLEVDTGAGYATSLTFDTDYICEPVNQIRSGIAGWPFTQLRSLGSAWPTRTVPAARDTVRVTGTFGWLTVPDDIKQATAIIAAMLWKLGDAPFGVAGFDQFGSVRVRDIPQAATLLSDYRRDETFGVA